VKTNLPKNFPEYSIMYKTLNKKIQDAENKKAQTKDATALDGIQSKIERYQKEVARIKSMFPEDFFEENI
jgi:hypothetical protein